MIIFKGVPARPGKKCGRRNSITYKLLNNLPDKWGNKYPNVDECYVTVSKTANSNDLLTVDYLKEVFILEEGVVAGELGNASRLLLDAFSGHHKQVVKGFYGFA